MKARTGKKTTQAERYQTLVAGTIELLEKGIAPWRKDWAAPRGPNRNHHNGNSGHQYKGFNPFGLDVAAMLRGYKSKAWLTFKDAQHLGGYIKKGEKGTAIAFWHMVEYIVKDEETNQNIKKTFPQLIPHTVFNLDQTDGVKLPKRETEEPEDKSFDPIAEAQGILDAYITNNGPKLDHDGGNEAFYERLGDSIHLPEPYQFKTREGYHAAAFHEAGHSTGHKSRLDRHSLQEEAGSVRFGSPVYSKEELVAELTASFLCDAAGITNTQENSAAYLKNWLGVIRKDGKFLVQSATKAQRAADFILAGGPQDAAKEKDEGYFKPQARKPGA